MDEIKTLALACISRLGSESPASEFASNTYLLKDLADILAKPGPTHIFVCGGCGFDYRDLKSTEIYSISDDTWEFAPDMPTAQYNCGIAHVGDSIFVLGGNINPADVSDWITDSVFVYSISKKEWRTSLPMSVKRHGPGVGVVDEKIYVFGGVGEKDVPLDVCEVFDIQSGKWETIAPMPTTRADPGIAVVGNLIYVIGGSKRDEWLATVEVFDTKINTWKKLTSMPLFRDSFGVAVIDDRFIWILGGYADFTPFDTIQIFDTVTGTWSISSTKLTSPRDDPRAISVGHKIYVVRGSYGSSDTRDNIEFLDTDTMKWTIGANVKIKRHCHAAIGF